MPEIGFKNNEMLSKEEIIEILNLKNQNMNILENLINKKKLKEINSPTKINGWSQTETIDGIINLEKQLNSVEENYKLKLLKETPINFEEKINLFKKELEKRLKLEMNSELIRFREFEASAIRIEEANRYSQQMENYREELEKTYQERISKFRVREKLSLDQCTDKMKFIETANHDHRQKILKDFELLKMREEQLEKQKFLDEEVKFLKKSIYF